MSLSDAERGGIQVISRAAAILRCLEAEPQGLSLGAIAKRIELPRSTVQRLVDALAMEQLVETGAGAGVRLGPALMRLATRSHFDLTARARPHLEALSQRTGETAVLAHASGLELMILHCVVSSQELRVAPGVNSLLSIYATSCGKVILAQMPERSVRELLEGKMRQLTPNTRTLEQLLEELKDVRAQGFSCDYEEHMPGVGAMAVALATAQGVYGLSLVGPAARIRAQEAAHKVALLACQAAITQGL
ncbi:IclR family transcriptional regulator [Pseudomonas sp. DC3000-4b1]|uniref:IclR family transcriptional regulator n=1 Tax=unclassified Pseudomonas TaxID=196821 RepID=UPI003CEA54F6